MRERLPRRRVSTTFSFRVADCEGYVTVGEYEDGRPGEVFIKVSKQGSTLAGIMDAFSISISLGLQHGVPLATYVRKYVEHEVRAVGHDRRRGPAHRHVAGGLHLPPSGARLLALDERAELGVLSTSERIQPTLPGRRAGDTPSEPGFAELPLEDRAPSAAIAPPTIEQPVQKRVVREQETVLCHVCGDIMQRAGTCHTCPSCGATSGCS